MNWFKKLFGKRLAYDIHGGKHLPTHKTLSTQYPSREALLVPNYYFNLMGKDGQEHLLQVQLGDYVYKNQVLTRPTSPSEVAQHAPTSGVITAIIYHPNLHPNGFKTPHLVLTADGLDHAQEALPALDYQTVSREALLERITECGINGLGGAGFPTARKLNHRANILVVNIAECEPYITCDDLQVREQAREILMGAEIAKIISGAEKIVIGIEDDKPEALQALQKALPDFPNTEIKVVPARYPSGNTRQLFELLFDVRVPAHAHATDYGFLCHNSGTLKAVYDAVVLGLPLIERYTTISGEGIISPTVLRAKIGTPLSALIAQAGGLKPNHRLIIGGPMMGFEQSDLSAGLQKIANALLALPAEPQGEEQPCIRCAECASACPMELLPQQLYWYSRADDSERLQQYRLPDCIECGLCSAVCPSDIPLVQYFRHSKGVLKDEREKFNQTQLAKERYEARNARLKQEAEEREAKMQARQARLEVNPPPEALPESNRAKLGEKPQIEQTPSFNPTVASPSGQMSDAIEQAKRRAEERKLARLKSASENENLPNPETDKLAEAKRKAEERKLARLEKNHSNSELLESASKNEINNPDLFNPETDKLAEAKRKAEERKLARLKSASSEKSAFEKENLANLDLPNPEMDKLAEAKRKAEERRQARKNKGEQS